MLESKLYGTGRRKRSVARVFMSPGKGNIEINLKYFYDFLFSDTLATILLQPFKSLILV